MRGLDRRRRDAAAPRCRRRRWTGGPARSRWACSACWSVAIALVGPLLLRRPRRPASAAACVLVRRGVVRPPTPGLAAAGLGAGGVRRRARATRWCSTPAPGAAVVVDSRARPGARSTAACDRLGVDEVPLVVLTHFHADHVDGLAGVFDGRSVGAVETTRLLDPPGGVRRGRVGGAARPGLVPAPAPYGETRRVGAVTLQALWPPPGAPTTGPGDGSTANEASVVLLVEVAGRPDPADRRRRARGAGGAGAGAAGPAGRRAEGAAPRQPLPGRALAALARRPGRAGHASAPTTTTATRPTRALRPLEARRDAGAAHRPATATSRWSSTATDLATVTRCGPGPRRRCAVAGCAHHGRSSQPARQTSWAGSPW